ncbi:hypothetical protein NJT12_05020 [Flavobacterium sp. AC]|uniref:Uncharacterized protein n=1 Tax=Flavobacterium azizsancarii TaxID=2961580 RepID=A0ABT4WA43_9FLAO|nr:hypothetical protein [Flavobacterium azizsancarii]MDA6068979.1 hypothetical protein [Flavobacterium azizsancarii]
MKKKYNIRELNLQEVHVEDLFQLVDPWALKVLLLLEDDNEDTEIMMENMLSYFVEVEQYEYAIVIRDLVIGKNEKANRF